MEPRTFRKDGPAMYSGYLARNLKERYEAFLVPYGLTGALYFYLRYLGSGGPCSPAELARSLGVDKAYVTRIVGQMEQQGYLVRRNNPEDSRSVLLSVTDSGMEILLGMEKLFADWDRELADGMSEQEYTMLNRLMEKAFRIKLGRPTDSECQNRP